MAELCVALDASDRGSILRTADAVAGEVEWLKLGLEAFTACGPGLIREVAERGCRVFLDLKLHDIPNTVARATANALATGADMLNVHVAGGRAMMTAAAAARDRVAAAAGRELSLIAVTLLTSLDRAALAELGLDLEPRELVPRWSAMARECGLDGVVASAREAATIRAACGPDFLIVTPGIRPAWAAADDQRRIVTPTAATRSGANIVVVGRPITTASDPAAAARRVQLELQP